MRQYVIVTESSCDLPMDIIQKYDIKIVLMTVMLEGTEYKNYPDGREISNHDLFESMRNKKLPSTSAPNYQDFLTVMEPIIASGKDILYIGVSGAMSSSYSVGSLVAKELMDDYPGSRILTIDSKCASMGEGLLVYLTAMKKDEGYNLDESYKFANENILHIIHTFTVDDLFHVMRSGRATKTSALLGTMLSIKPIVNVNNEGLMDTVGKARGRNKAYRELIDSVRENVSDLNTPVFIGHGDCETDALEFAEKLKAETGLKNVRVEFIGAVCGCHAGPGLICLFYHGKNRNIGAVCLSDVS